MFLWSLGSNHTSAVFLYKCTLASAVYSYIEMNEELPGESVIPCNLTTPLEECRSVTNLDPHKIVHTRSMYLAVTKFIYRNSAAKEVVTDLPHCLSWNALQNRYLAIAVYLSFFSLVPFPLFPVPNSATGPAPQSTYRDRGEIGGVFLPSLLERKPQLCS